MEMMQNISRFARSSDDLKDISCLLHAAPDGRERLILLGWNATPEKAHQESLLFLPPLSPPPLLSAVQVELFSALCKALPHLGALRTLELEGLSKAFEKVIHTASLMLSTVILGNVDLRTTKREGGGGRAREKLKPTRMPVHHCCSVVNGMKYSARFCNNGPPYRRVLA